DQAIERRPQGAPSRQRGVGRNPRAARTGAGLGRVQAGRVLINHGCFVRGRAMRHPISKTIAATAMGAVLLAAVSAAAVPAVRHIASGWWNSPERLAALPENPQVHYEDGAFEYARTVAGLLPTAIARVEAMHGRRFAHPVTVGVYVSPEGFVAANGLGDRGAVGMTFLGRVVLSPVLFSTQRIAGSRRRGRAPGPRTVSARPRQDAAFSRDERSPSRSRRQAHPLCPV